MEDNTVTAACVRVCVSNQQMVKADGPTASNHIAGALCRESLNSNSSLQLPQAFNTITVHTQTGFMSGLKQPDFSRTVFADQRFIILTFFQFKSSSSCLKLCPFRLL